MTVVDNGCMRVGRRLVVSMTHAHAWHHCYGGRHTTQQVVADVGTAARGVHCPDGSAANLHRGVPTARWTDGVVSRRKTVSGL
jgi:hypothetical protein